MRLAEVVVARRILRDLRVLRNADPPAFRACVDRVLNGLREDARMPDPARLTCPHGATRGHWLGRHDDPGAYCPGPDRITRYLETHGVEA